MKRLSAIGLFAVAAMTPPPLAAQAQSPGQAFVDISTHLAIDEKCKILPPVEKLALTLSRDELRPAVPASDAVLIDQRMAQVQAFLAQKPCADPELAAARAPILQAASYYQAVWSARVVTAANLRSGELWATWSPVAGVKRSAAERRLAELGTVRPGADKQLLGMVRPEAVRMMSIACPTMSTNAAKCPALTPPPVPGEAEVAKLWGERVEKFAAQLGGARLDGQPVLPEGVSGWDELYTPIALDMALVPGLPPQDCKAGTIVAMVKGSKAILYNARDGFAIGEGEVTPVGVALTIRSPQLGGMDTALGLIACKAP